MVGTQTFRVKTVAGVQFINITDEVDSALREMGLSSGIVNIFSPHTTSALLITEDEKGLVSDLIKEVQQLIDWNKSFEHNRIDNNAPSHLTGAFLGPSLVVPVSDGGMRLGTWQSIFFVELDGPRDRMVIVNAVGE